MDPASYFTNKYSPSYKLHLTLEQIPNLVHTNANLSVKVARDTPSYEILSTWFSHKSI